MNAASDDNRRLREEIKEAFRRAGIVIIEEDLSTEMTQLARKMADAIAYEGNRYLNDVGITDQGTLAGSSVVVPNDEGGYDAAWLAEHADWINYGTDPHAVSAEGVRNIEEWVARKLKPTPNPGETQSKANARVASAIVWNIRKYGSEPKPFVDVAIETVEQRFSQ